MMAWFCGREVKPNGMRSAPNGGIVVVGLSLLTKGPERALKIIECEIGQENSSCVDAPYRPRLTSGLLCRTITTKTQESCMQPIRLGLVGYGKIAQDQHVPAIHANPAFELVAVATQGQPCAGVENFKSLGELLASGPQVDAIAFCTPPQGRFALVQEALAAGKHVLVEKPPCATLGEAMALVTQVQEQGVSGLFAWHSRYAQGIEAAREWLSTRTLQSVQIDWKEDVRKWHPGQAWIWQPGGLGVFDPGINALSIVTHLLPLPLFVESAELRVPSNCQSPIAASIKMSDTRHLDIRAEFDFDHGHDELWSIEIRCAEGTLRLDNGGALLSIDGVPQSVSEEGEYAAVYRHFQQLIGDKTSDLDLQPLRLVADSFFVGSRASVEPFYD
ncbi:D-galactose 1-dehydrogenase [Pseudomonas syringae pv. aptata]|uniref:D-galactose 1-dehydrogenase n=1 Tax=Pseudomonas syringae pv. aptata TaxID=83167 RepID=A0A3M5WVT7_PSEAP|nr:D-galactose 1-dehydrogenase [Pseudomonas syringae pv. aptata]